MNSDVKSRRYRHAAEAALDQIDWCISYLRAIGRHEIARALSRNRHDIRRRLRERPR